MYVLKQTLGVHSFEAICGMWNGTLPCSQGLIKSPSLLASLCCQHSALCIYVSALVQHQLRVCMHTVSPMNHVLRPCQTLFLAARPPDQLLLLLRCR